MSKTPRQRAEACFAVARSTAHEGERESAIGRGKFICSRNGLDLDDFEIPGRVRKVPRGGMSGGSFDMDLDLNAGFTRRESTFSSSQDDLFGYAARFSMDDLAAAFEAMARASSRAARAAEDEAIRNAYQQQPEPQCPTCSHYKRESRFGAPCYDCVPKTVDEETAGRKPYAAFHEFGTINRPERPRRPFRVNSCPGCGAVILYGDSCIECDRRR